MSDPAKKFQPRKHHNKVLDCARAMGFGGTKLNILRVMCWEAEWDQPTVTISQGAIAELAGHHIQTVKAAIKELKAAGLLIPTANPRGGRYRNSATTFKLWAKTLNGYSEATNSDETPKNAINGYSLTTTLVATDSPIGSEGHLLPINHINHTGSEGIKGDPSRAENPLDPDTPRQEQSATERGAAAALILAESGFGYAKPIGSGPADRAGGHEQEKN